MNRQCLLSHPTPRGIMTTVCWIPETVSRVGMWIEDESGEAWQVQAVYPWKLDNVPHVAGQIRQHRKRTGDAERKAHP